jgi:hypothetical protein
MFSDEQLSAFGADVCKLFDLRGNNFLPYAKYDAKWHIPEQDEIDFVAELVGAYVLPTLDWIDNLNSRRETNQCVYSKEQDRECLWHNLTLLHYFIRGVKGLLKDPNSEATVELHHGMVCALYKHLVLIPLLLCVLLIRALH